jgi:hypothetical protein
MTVAFGGVSRSPTAMLNTTREPRLQVVTDYSSDFALFIDSLPFGELLEARVVAERIP